MRIAALIFLALASTATAGSLSLEAHEVGTQDERISNWETDYGSYNRDSIRSKKILVTLHNLSRKPVPFAVTVYFIGKPTVAPNSIGYDRRIFFIYDRREHAGEFHDEIELKGTFSSHAVASNVTHYEALGVESASGADMIGWIAIGYSEGHYFGVAASNQELLQLAEGKSHQSFDKMIADYEKKGHPTTLSAKRPAASPDVPPPAEGPSQPIVASPPPQQQVAEFVTLTRPVEVTITYGRATLPAGTRLKVVSHNDASVSAYYMGDTVVIPANAAR